MSWKNEFIGNLLIESRIPATNPNPDKRIRVKLNIAGVEKRPLENEIEGATKQFVRKSGQFIYGKQNFHKGAFGIIPEELDGFETSADIPSFDLREDSLPEWIFYFFKIGNRYLELEKIARGVGSKRIHPEQLKDIEIPLPSLDFQKVLISRFKKFEKSVGEVETEHTHQLTLLKNLRQQILQDAVQGKLVPQNPNDEPASKLLERIKTKKEFLINSKKLKSGKSTEQSINYRDENKIPESWIWCKTDDIFFVTKLAGFEYTDHINLQETGEIPVIRAQNVRPLDIDKTNLLFIDKETSLQLDRCSLTKKCLLVTFIGAGIGDVATFNENERWHLAPNVAKMEPFEGCEKMVEIKFVNYFLMSNIGQRELFKHIKATAQPSLSMGTIRDIDIPLPPLPEQHRIVAKIDQLMGLCNKLEHSIQQNQQYTQELLQVALKEALEGRETK